MMKVTAIKKRPQRPMNSKPTPANAALAISVYCSVFGEHPLDVFGPEFLLDDNWYRWDAGAQMHVVETEYERRKRKMAEALEAKMKAEEQRKADEEAKRREEELRLIKERRRKKKPQRVPLPIDYQPPANLNLDTVDDCADDRILASAVDQSKTAQQKPKKKKGKGKPKPPRNLCWEWKTLGFCPRLVDKKKCKFDHDAEWKGEPKKNPVLILKK